MTYFSEIYDKYAMPVIRDYQLDKLAQADYEAFLLHLEGILINAIPDFDGCLKSLDYEYVEQETEEGMIRRVPVFKADLDYKEKSILGKLMVIKWFTSKVQDVTQFQGSLNTREFKKFSESNNLKQKSVYLNGLIEKFEQEVTDYQLNNLAQMPYFEDF